MRAHIVAGEGLNARDEGDDIAVVDRQIERSARERIIASALDPFRSFDDVALDEDFLPEPRFVVDRGRAEDGVTVGSDRCVPLPL